MKRSRRLKRSGVAAVEFALVLPFLLLMFFAAIEFSRANTVNNSVGQAAYEGARRAILPGASVEEVEDAVLESLSPIRVSGTEVTVSPDPIPDDAEAVTVEVSVPMDQNSYTLPRFFKGYNLDSACTLRCERSLANTH